MSRASAAETWRGEGANTNPRASAPMATARSASSSLVVPQIFTNTGVYPVPPATAVRPACGVDCRLTVRDRTAAAGSEARTSVSPTSTAS